MDFLNQAYAQLYDLFRSMTPGARIIGGLLLAVIVVSLGYLIKYEVYSADAYLFHGEQFQSGEMFRMEAAFHAAGLNDFEFDGPRIMVPRRRHHEYMAALVQADALPRGFGAYFEKAFADAGTFAGNSKTKSMLEVAKQLELGAVISWMEDVEKAAVVYSQKDRPGLGKEDVAVASVNIQTVGGKRLEPDQVKGIRSWVLGAFAGLKPENVHIVDAMGRYADVTADGLSADDNPFFALTAKYEKHLEEKILAAFSDVPGISVKATFDLDRAMVEQTKSVEYKDALKVASSTATSESIQEGLDSGGRVGAVAQQGANARAAVNTAPTPRSTTKETDDEYRSVLPGQTTEKELAGLTPQNARILITVPESYYRKVWELRNPVVPGDPPKDPTPANLANIETEFKSKVTRGANVLLTELAPGADEFPRVEIVSLSDLTPAPIQEASFVDRMFAWLNLNWSTMGALLLAVFALLTVRSMIRSALAAAELSASREEMSAPNLEQENEEEVEKAPVKTLRRTLEHGPSLRDQLSELVREDPDAAATILRNWIGSAG